MDYNLKAKLAIMNRRPDIKGSFEARFNRKTGNYHLDLVFRSNRNVLLVDTAENCWQYLDQLSVTKDGKIK